MQDNSPLKMDIQNPKPVGPISYATDNKTLIKLIGELSKNHDKDKLYLESEDGTRREVLLKELESEFETLPEEIEKVILERDKSGIVNTYEFSLVKEKTKKFQKGKLKIVKPLELEFPLINKHYLSIKRSEKIIKMGTFYNNLFKNENMHEFGFIGSSHESCPYVVNTMISLALFFAYHENFTVNMILNKENIKKVCLHFGESTSDSIQFSGREIPVSKIERINLIDIEDLASLAKQIRRRNIFQNFYNKNDQITLWQVPSVEAMEEKKVIYFPLMEVIHNVTLVSLKGDEKIKNIKEAIDYFTNLNIEVLGNIWAVKKL